jgi:hypothetical protein
LAEAKEGALQAQAATNMGIDWMGIAHIPQYASANSVIQPYLLCHSNSVQHMQQN